MNNSKTALRYWRSVQCEAHEADLKLLKDSHADMKSSQGAKDQPLSTKDWARFFVFLRHSKVVTGRHGCYFFGALFWGEQAV